MKSKENPFRRKKRTGSNLFKHDENKGRRQNDIGESPGKVSKMEERKENQAALTEERKGNGERGKRRKRRAARKSDDAGSREQNPSAGKAGKKNAGSRGNDAGLRKDDAGSQKKDAGSRMRGWGFGRGRGGGGAGRGRGGGARRRGCCAGKKRVRWWRKNRKPAPQKSAWWCDEFVEDTSQPMAYRFYFTMF